MLEKPVHAKKPPKGLRRIGKKTLEYNKWRDEIAIPYLDKTYGHFCFDCGAGGKLDVAHIRGRGSHPELRMILTNVNYMCRSCHMRADSGFRYR